MSTHSYYTGCAIWGYKEWLGDLFPTGSKASDFLALYSRRLTAVEGNTTFYATPRPEVVQRWADETPETFRFCLKLPREISHSGAAARQIATTHAFIQRMRPLGERLGPFFLQLPASYGPSQLGDLAAWLAEWPAAQRLAVEVRHPGWYAEPAERALTQLLEQHGASRVLMDVRPLSAGPLPGAEADLEQAREKKPDVPLHPLHSGGLAFVRYIAHPDMPLNQPFLDEWAARVAGWLNAGITTYFFMHCPLEQYSPGICRRFYAQLARSRALPPLPWDTLAPALEQSRMF